MSIRHTYMGLIGLALCVGAFAQSLSIPQSTVKPGATGSLLLRLESPSGKAPVALQWKFLFPKAIIVQIPDIVAASAAESAEKTLTCTFVYDAKQSATRMTCACILAGGKQPIGNGPIAAVRYRLAPGVSAMPDKVRAESILAVTADLKKVAIPNAEGVIVVQ